MAVGLTLTALAGCSSKDSSGANAGDGGSGENVSPNVDGSDQNDAGSDAGPSVTCPQGEKTGDPSGKAKTAGGTNVLVRVPLDYDPTVGRKLVVSFSPAGADAGLNEKFTGLTIPATGRGFIIAYADNIAPTDQAAIKEAASVVDVVTKGWCVDPKRIYLTGHSNGGTMAEVLAAENLVLAAAIAPSASGVDSDSMKNIGCPKTLLPVMEIHSSGDLLFPISQGFGADVAAFWAKCNSCDPTPGPAAADGCTPYTGCHGDLEVRYCQGKAEHGYWPPSQDPPPTDGQILDFFDRFALH